MKYKFVLFDLDGTITDPFEGITNSIIYALKKFGIEETDKNKLVPFIGPPLVDSFAKYYGFSHGCALAAVGYYREYYADKGIFECMLYDGIAELLRELKESGVKVIMATSKPE
ncbi:MAG: HAD hydrolase-like protein, partial [Clostridia bacterium]|nr:HAD hydrolase-like protein [Clostridia bacterium]